MRNSIENFAGDYSFFVTGGYIFWMLIQLVLCKYIACNISEELTQDTNIHKLLCGKKFYKRLHRLV